MQLVGGQFDLEMNFIIQETESITCMVELLDKCDSTCQAEVWSMFTAVLKKSLRNLQACTEVGLIQLVLQRIDRVDAMIAGVWNGGIFRHQMIFQLQFDTSLFRVMIQYQFKFAAYQNFLQHSRRFIEHKSHTCQKVLLTSSFVVNRHVQLFLITKG